MGEWNGQENKRENGMSRKVFFKMASAAGFGTMMGTYLFNISGYDFLDNRIDTRHNLGVHYRIKGTKANEGWSFSVTEVIMEPGSETYVMLNQESVATYESISGHAIVLSAKDKLEPKTPRVSRTLQRMVKPGKHYQILNPSNQRARLIQRFEPYWQPDKSFIKIGAQMTPGKDLWFELQETLNRQGTGLKYRLLKQTPGTAELQMRVEPGVKSVWEYYKSATHHFKVIQGSGMIIIDGKKQELKEHDEIKITPGSKFQFHNPFPNRWEMALQAKPGWLPDDSFYEVDGKLIPGSDIWFAIRVG